ncbi:MAG: dephospho-CoA kinase [Peptostreptococcaceae bacterium]|nr:dephospho-CoA kinase [Peptostreptococcaceae bacterium]
MKIIGLTGGIGSGKTTVSEYLTEKGFQVIDADKVARKIVEPKKKATKAIELEFGTDMINPDGSLNRKKLGDTVFSDKEKLLRLNEITHKEIVDKIKIRILELENDNSNLIFIDAPLLFETGIDSMVHETWVIDTPVNLRIERVKKRDSMDDEKIESRIANQMEQHLKNIKATIVIDNSLGKEELYKKIDQLIKKYEV